MRGFYITVLAIVFTVFGSCTLDCAERKVGYQQSSESIKHSKKNGVFRFEMKPAEDKLYLDSGIVVKIDEAWVENAWSYECIDNDPVIVRDTGSVLVIKLTTTGPKEQLYKYTLKSYTDSAASYITGKLAFSYRHDSAVKLELYKDVDKYAHSSKRWHLIRI